MRRPTARPAISSTAKITMNTKNRVLAMAMEVPAMSRHGITFEYVMIENVNDSIQDAKKLVKFVHGLKAKVNLIPVNQFPGMPMNSSTQERIKAFQAYLSERSIPAPVRYSRGQDISGGCGQLAAKRKEEIDLDPRVLHREKRKAASLLMTNELSVQ